LDGKKYYGFNMEIPAGERGLVKDYFEDFGAYDEILNGWITCEPGQVGEILGGIPIDAGY